MSIVHPIPSSVKDDEDVPDIQPAEDICWMDFSGVLATWRTSPGTATKTAWRPLAIAAFANSINVPVVRSLARQNQSGYRLEKEFREAIDYAREHNLVIVDIEPSRLARDLRKLARVAKGVKFGTLLKISPHADGRFVEREINKLAHKWIKFIDPDAKFGRPRDSTDDFSLPFILSRIGHRDWPFTRIAKELGPNWSDKKVMRLLDALFPYSPLPGKRLRQNTLHM